MKIIKKVLLPDDPPRVVLITGGTSGIGRAAALLFAALGDQVAVTGRRVDRLQALAAQVEADELPGVVLPLEADVTDADAMRRAVALTLAEFNRLDVLVANAGYAIASARRFRRCGRAVVDTSC